MKARTPRGEYTGHNTPGDGTGFSVVPTEDAQTFLGRLRPERESEVVGPHGADRHTPVKGKGV